MHTVELLEEALSAAEQLGYRVRHEWLSGSGGGDCEINGRKWLFVDLALSPSEQLEVVINSLGRDARVPRLRVSQELGQRLGIRRVA